MRVLISNDDGIGAPGIERLERIAGEFSDDVWVVAPESDNSGAGHSLTLSEPVRARQLSERRFAVNGTPTDCVLMGVLALIPDKRPDLVLSGINQGGNLGEDITYSGTVAAAMEGTLLGIPSIGLSQHRDDAKVTPWETAESHAPGLLRSLIEKGWPANVFLNVNFPNVPADKVKGVSVTRQGRRKPGSKLDRREDPRGRAYYWIDSARIEEPTLEGSDLSAIYDGRISVTPLHLDLTHHETCVALGASLAS
ncbi:MAG: 5'/3'-nucleotidase SurE [Alphaproteobacteria bacterium]|nr:5'/3'-nucleotidase SurE [Alphaproteobacteria bacterium]